MREALQKWSWWGGGGGGAQRWRAVEGTRVERRRQGRGRGGGGGGGGGGVGRPGALPWAVVVRIHQPVTVAKSITQIHNAPPFFSSSPPPLSIASPQDYCDLQFLFSLEIFVLWSIWFRCWTFAAWFPALSIIIAAGCWMVKACHYCHDQLIGTAQFCQFLLIHFTDIFFSLEQLTRFAKKNPKNTVECLLFGIAPVCLFLKQYHNEVCLFLKQPHNEFAT